MPTNRERGDKSWHIHDGVSLSLEQEGAPTPVPTWVNLKEIMPSESSQTRKVTRCGIQST